MANRRQKWAPINCSISP